MYYFLFSEDCTKFDGKNMVGEIKKIVGNIFFIFFDNKKSSKNQKFIKSQIQNCGFVNYDGEKQGEEEKRVVAFLQSLKDFEGCFVCRDFRVFKSELVEKILRKKDERNLDIVTVVQKSEKEDFFSNLLYKIRNSFWKIVSSVLKYKLYQGSTQLIYFSKPVVDVIKILPNTTFFSKVNGFIGFKEGIVADKKLPKQKFIPSKKSRIRMSIVITLLCLTITSQILLNLFLKLSLIINFVLGGLGLILIFFCFYYSTFYFFERKVGKLK